MIDLIQPAIERLDQWISKNGWVGYDPFDGLTAPLAHYLTLEVPLLKIALEQTVRRLPFNLRPLLGITKKHSTKAMGYFANGYLRLYQVTGQQNYLDKALECLSDLRENYSRGYSGYAWGNAFDHQSRGGFQPKGLPTIVWTAFIGYSFVDTYEVLSDSVYLDVARSSCEFILRDLSKTRVTDQSLCISYAPGGQMDIHNSNMLGAALLARVYKHTREPELLEIAQKAVRYTMDHQLANGSWYYGEGLRFHWVDGYHTGFVLDALYWYMQATGDDQYETQLVHGMDYYREHLADGVIPKHYSNARYPVDIQAVAQIIQTFAFIPKEFHGDVSWADEIACWAIEHMQDPSGYFYFRKGRLFTNKVPFLHWGQSTMLAALALLLQHKQLKVDETTMDKKADASLGEEAKL
jgi:rhamnogalacturonyl hydrolase YesR